ncbi:MAG: hypothetical protein M3545_18825, partial [Acidobacteriota bacterium]|nr:hypothetical protein [Acidobacteriota bacterium]
MQHRPGCRAPLAAGLVIFVMVALTVALRAQQADHAHAALDTAVPLQPLAMQARRLETALAYLGEPLPAAARASLNEALALEDERIASARIQEVLDAYVLADVHINPESRVRVRQGTARPELVQGGTRVFLVKVVNEAGVTAPL